MSARTLFSVLLPHSSTGFLVASFLTELARTARPHRFSDSRSTVTTGQAAALYAAATATATAAAAGDAAASQAPRAALEAAPGAAPGAGAATGAADHQSSPAMLSQPARLEPAAVAATAAIPAAAAIVGGTVGERGVSQGSGPGAGNYVAPSATSFEGSAALPIPIPGVEAGSRSSVGSPRSVATPMRLLSSSSSAASLSTRRLVLSCIHRAENMIRSGSRSGASTGSPDVGTHVPGLAGVLHVLLLLVTGVAEAERGSLVSTQFHVQVCVRAICFCLFLFLGSIALFFRRCCTTLYLL